uniref:GST N-terminal domain-containing protein n=1 Tax=Alexandrium monilatum TaxID=311494 RepID=A0A7S4UI50_9DINO
MASLPSWEEIESQAAAAGYSPSRRRAELLRTAERPGKRLRGGRRLLLWRDDFGWCPFSQQAQLHLEEKGAAYQVRKVPLTVYRIGDRDPEFLSDSPNGLVPALRILEADDQQDATTSAPSMPAVGTVAVGAVEVRTFIEDQCEGPPLLRCAGVSHCLVKAYLELADCFEKQQHALLKAAVDASLAPASGDKANAVQVAERFLISTLEDIDQALSEADEGPYFFGSVFSVVDIAFAPWVDRAAALLSWLRNREVRGGHLRSVDAWLAAMNVRPAHRSLRLDDETIVRIALASRPALANGRPGLGLGPAPGPAGPETKSEAGADAEAAQCLVACRAGVAALAAQRAPGAAEAVDGLLRAVAALALGAPEVGAAADLVGGAPRATADLAAAAIFVRSRLAVPRDMSAPAARILRRSLEAVTAALVGLEKTDTLLAKELAAYGEKVRFLSRV